MTLQQNNYSYQIVNRNETCSLFKYSCVDFILIQGSIEKKITETTRNTMSEDFTRDSDDNNKDSQYNPHPLSLEERIVSRTASSTYCTCCVSVAHVL